MESLEAQLKGLMLAGLAGNRQAYACLLELTRQRLHLFFGRRLGSDAKDLEDLVQETLIAIHERRASYDIRLPFTAWLHAIAKYKLVDHYRRVKVRAAVSLDGIDEPMAEDSFGPALARIDLDRLLARLPAGQQDAIRLTRIEGISVVEAADRTGQSEANVKVSVHRGLKRLMEHVQGLKSK
ncbi:MAG TPA: sigma-70 family RNA polymerase sigma factor [Rhizomicrobium sp.]|nr:sigma-70 family RNA polymerase sigma factor [Rhizomicrobium sp.]